MSMALIQCGARHVVAMESEVCVGTCTEFMGQRTTAPLHFQAGGDPLLSCWIMHPKGGER